MTYTGNSIADLERVLNYLSDAHKSRQVSFLLFIGKTANFGVLYKGKVKTPILVTKKHSNYTNMLFMNWPY